jgi:serine phosphatase RsbU (regulator of sigma subunit)
VALGDVSGHGVRSAMFTGMLIFALRSALRVDPRPRELLRLLRQETDFFEPPNFATMVYGWLTDDGACNYFNAGHPDIFWQHEDEVRLLPSTATLLMNAPFPVPDQIASISPAPGDRLVICSDGLLEARYDKGAQFGKERMQGAIRSASLLPIPEAIDAILACMDEHCRHRPQADDITLLIVERL